MKQIFAILMLVAFAAVARADRPPNIVLVFCDDLGYADIGPFGSKTKTPHLDRLAKEGNKLTQFYVAQAVCSASRAALLTGKYSHKVGILGALNHTAKHGLPQGTLTIADVLKRLGYATAIFGKWHLGHLAEHLPGKHGFDEYYGLPYSNDMWPKHPTAKFPDLPLIEGEKTIAVNPDQNLLTTQYTERAVKFIEKNKDGPFFVYLPHSMPHVPLHVSERFKGKSGQGMYGDVIQEIDWSVGQILETLDRLKLADNTIVIFTSDNGPWLSYGNHGGSAGILREGKGTSWEGGVRVPFLIRWPGRIPANQSTPVPAMTIDMLPTLARMAGAKLPDGYAVDGKDVSAILKGEPNATSPHEAYYFYWGKQLQAVRSGPWKLYLPHAYRTLAGQPGGQDGKPAPYREGKTGVELYHLENDPSETRDVTRDNPEVVRRLEALAKKQGS